MSRETEDVLPKAKLGLKTRQSATLAALAMVAALASSMLPYRVEVTNRSLVNFKAIPQG